MDYELAVRTAPTFLAVSIGEAKQQIRVEADESDEDAYIKALIEDATELVGDLSDRTLAQTAYTLKLDRFPVGSGRYRSTEPVYLPKPELVSVDEVRYTDENGDTQTLDTVQVSTGLRSVIVPDYDTCWPATRRISNAVEIDYTSGHASATAIPRRARRAILLLIGDWFRNREDAGDRKQHTIPNGVQALIEQLRPGDDFAAVTS